MIPSRTSEAFSFSPYCVAICTAPCSINTMPKETATMINVLNLESHATIMAVKPRPPAVAVEIVWLAPLTITKPAIPQIAPEIAMVRTITFFTWIPAYFAVFSLSPTTAIS